MSILSTSKNVVKHIFSIYYAYFEKFGFDTAKNESLKVWKEFNSFIHSPRIQHEHLTTVIVIFLFRMIGRSA